MVTNAYACDGGGIGTKRIGAGTGRDDIATNGVAGRIFGDGVGVGIGKRCGVGDVDDQIAGLRITVIILDDNADRVEDITARVVLGSATRVVAVGHNTGRRVVAGDGHHTLRGGDADVDGAAVLKVGLAYRRAGDSQGCRRV